MDRLFLFVEAARKPGPDLWTFQSRHIGFMLSSFFSPFLVTISGVFFILCFYYLNLLTFYGLCILVSLISPFQNKIGVYVNKYT